MNEKLKVSLALPSSIPINQKTNLVKKANEYNFGIYCSDLPPNHDLFQLLSFWSCKYPSVKPLGTAIISPFSYPLSVLLKQMKTIFETHQDKIEIGIGVGDPSLISETHRSPFKLFTEKIQTILMNPEITEYRSQIALAGAGNRILRLAVDSGLSIIFNGIPDQNLLLSLGKGFNFQSLFSTYVMVDFNNFQNLSIPFIKVVSRIMAGLPKSEQKRLNVDIKVIKNIRNAITKGKWIDYQKWLPENLLRQVSFIGEIFHDFQAFKNEIASLGLKQIIVSIPSADSRKKWFEFLK
ncbi:MAG: hypothetical protein ACXAC7_02145 [Candidatus Hodarchaeales archaeon]|jgi:hypothetical protein